MSDVAVLIENPRHGVLVDDESDAPAVVVEVPSTARGIALVVGGPQGPPGPTGGTFLHTQAIASTVWLIDHGLDFDPGGVTVLDGAGVQHFPVMTYPAAGEVQLAFLTAVAGSARLS